MEIFFGNKSFQIMSNTYLVETNVNASRKNYLNEITTVFAMKKTKFLLELC